MDPPYNTGNDFVYNDDFAENTDDYLRRSGQVDDAGARLSANTESNGRFHSDWLSMILPRLKLARNLLTDDGAIFISINDAEMEIYIALRPRSLVNPILLAQWFGPLGVRTTRNSSRRHMSTF
ncbi:hypothetical protein L0A91_04565 [Ornithinimicrobium sp. INDO-MA30-4]|nr:hypothetical protein L0A91_04565 [Ornithinimicrobium sp. INDO-MA30-4]